jgi:hypothetical protein
VFRVYGNAWAVRSAGQNYRVRIPLTAMQRLGLATTFIDDPFQDQFKRTDQLFTSHVQLHHLTAGKSFHQQALMVKDLKPAKDSMGFMQRRPAIVFDMDDDIESINPLNPKYATLGTRDAEGNLLGPRAELGIQIDDDPLGGPSEPVFLWRHRQETAHGSFDSGRNIINHAHVRKMAATADAITCTSQVLADEVAKRWNEKVYVYPNCILFDEFHRFDIRRDPTDVRVLWQGGYSHFPDFYPLKGGFASAARRLPQVKWVVFGTLFPWVYNSINPTRVEFHQWVDFNQWHIKYGTLAFDVNVAPLADTRFNRCKTAIKFYEAAALGIPTIAQNSGPFRDEIIDGDTGYLFSTPGEFVDKLEVLVKDVDKRKAMGKRAEEWVRENRDAMKVVPKLYEFYVKLWEEVHGVSLAA